MKKLMIIPIALFALLVLTATFFIGIYVASRSPVLPKDTVFQVDGYFSNIQKTNLPDLSEEYPYFIHGWGASQQENENYLANPQDYAAYQADLMIENHTNKELTDIWAVLPGAEIKDSPTDGFKVKWLETQKGQTMWINAWLNEGGTFLNKNESQSEKLQIIVLKDERSEEEILEQIKSQQINLQIGICMETLDYPWDMSRNISYTLPIFYQ
ncbi:Uncharacterised protein [uncultured Ruminococcus sp.]|uniref:Uncharacterized protein n=1 Tax=Massiliimalia timonensis TaxID=1987501 RepID=A0A8J6P5W9_9FIRM|nr:hypothetical protein [Massiliimalia timonensis]MBC8611613.1 hypothetical protein [Massiliimalia timonensis]SCH56265.1 Uncharacterised protein [uncultured Clostridium sp.]SCH68056.1 Uncharacterised protein [uncultured Ruminococcus sp.]